MLIFLELDPVVSHLETYFLELSSNLVDLAVMILLHLL